MTGRAKGWPMTTMMALRAHRRGGPEVLVYEAARRPEPGVGEVLIQVHAAGITFAELTWDRTWLRGGTERTPIIPSREVSGMVVELGPEVDDLHVGDLVCGVIRFDYDGAAAEYVVAPGADLAAKPATVSHAVAAALPLAALTAWQALVVHARLRRGDRVLVHGGAGGVGAFAVQLATQLGGVVTTTVRGTDPDLVRSLGAERVLDVAADRAGQVGQGFDVVLDTVGGAVLDASYPVLRPGGRLITLPSPFSQQRAAQHGIEATFFLVTPDRFELARLARLVDRRELRVLVAASFPLHQGRDAFELGVDGGNAARRPGKVVLQVIRDGVEYTSPVE